MRQLRTAIQNAPKPFNSYEVRRFLSLVNYFSWFIPNFSCIAVPLRQLTHKGTPFTWTRLHQHAFESLQKAMTSDSVMAHFDPRAPTQLRLDASPVGLGTILTQTHGDVTRPVAYAWRTLTTVERRYSQAEREAKDFICICTGQPLTFTQTTNLSKLSTVRHRTVRPSLATIQILCQVFTWN